MKHASKLLIARTLDYMCLLPFAMLLSTVLVVDQHFISGLANGEPRWFVISIILVSITTLVSRILRNKDAVYTKVDIYIIFLCIIGMLTSYQYYKDVSSEFLLFTIALYLFIYFRVFLSQSKNNQFVVILLFIFTGLAEAVWGIFQKNGLFLYHLSDAVPAGSFRGTDYYSGYIAMIFPLAVYYIIKDLKLIKRSITKRSFPKHVRLMICLLSILFIIPALVAVYCEPACIAALVGSIYVIANYYLSPSLNKYMEKINKKTKNQLRIAILSLFVISSTLYGIHSISQHSTLKETTTYISEDSYNFAKLLTKVELSELPPFTEQSVVTMVKDVRLRIVASYIILGMIVFGTFYLGMKKKKTGLTGSFLSIMLFSLVYFPFNLLPFCIAITFLIPACTLLKPQPLEEEYEYVSYNILPSEDTSEEIPVKWAIEGFFTGILWIGLFTYFCINYM